MEYVKIFEYDHFSDYIDDIEEPINDELKKKGVTLKSINSVEFDNEGHNGRSKALIIVVFEKAEKVTVPQD